MMQETLALHANLDICQCGKMEGSVVLLVHVTKLAQQHVPKIQLVTRRAIVILGMMETNVRNALLITTFFHFLIVQEVNQVSKIVKAF